MVGGGPRRRGDALSVQAALNEARDGIRCAVERFHAATGQNIIGSFEVYRHDDGRVDYRITADSQVLYKANDSLDTPAAHFRAIELYLIAHQSHQRVPTDLLEKAVGDLNSAFDGWRRKPTQFTFDTFAAAATVFGVR